MTRLLVWCSLAEIIEEASLYKCYYNYCECSICRVPEKSEFKAAEPLEGSV